jgi:hypothetical protein
MCVKSYKINIETLSKGSLVIVIAKTAGMIEMAVTIEIAAAVTTMMAAENRDSGGGISEGMRIYEVRIM